MYSKIPDLPAAHTIRKLALCRDENSNLLLTSVEMSQIIEYLCTIHFFKKALTNEKINNCASTIIVRDLIRMYKCIVYCSCILECTHAHMHMHMHMHICTHVMHAALNPFKEIKSYSIMYICIIECNCKFLVDFL